MIKYRAEDVEMYYPRLPWPEASRLAWPGVDPKNTDKCKKFIDRKLNNTKLSEKIPLISDATLNFTDTISNGTRTIVVPKTEIKSLEELELAFKVDKVKWKVKNWECKHWQMGFKNADGVGESKDLFACKATFEENKTVSAIHQEIESIISKVKDYAPQPIFKPRYTQTTAGNLLEISIFDPHLRKHCWGIETNWDNYDLGIATKYYLEAADHIINSSLHLKPEKIVYIIGQDFYNADSISNMTTAGTLQDCDTRFHKAFSAGFDVAQAVIEKLVQIAPVHIIGISGNHDTLSAWHLTETLRAWYHNYKEITWDNTPASRKYWEWGECMSMVTHGDRGKKSDFGMLMAVEQPQMWARCKYREVHLGHFHQEAIENHGVKVRTIPSLSAADNWHSKNGYIGNLREAMGFVWNKTHGMTTALHYTIPTNQMGRSLDD